MSVIISLFIISTFTYLLGLWHGYRHGYPIAWEQGFLEGHTLRGVDNLTDGLNVMEVEQP